MVSFLWPDRSSIGRRRTEPPVDLTASLGARPRVVHETSTELVTESGTEMTDPIAPAPTVVFGDLLRRHRSETGVTQEGLAEQAGISARTVSDIERGLRYGVYRDTARRLADALHLEGSNRAAFESAARRTKLGGAYGQGLDSDGRAMASDLPSPLTRLIGREAELAAIVAALESREVRVLTIVGPGGIGKTRMALEVATMLRETFADGAAFVPLAVTREAALVPALVAREMRLTSIRKPIEEALRDHLRGREMLLVLDTFEHLLPAAAFVAELAVACPRLTVVVTSRTPLDIRGEHEVHLEPLAVPPAGGPAAQLDQFPAVALFVERGRAVRSDLVLDPASAAAIAEICRRLEGLPLALELAAVRLRHMPLAALREALDHRLDVLVDGPRDLPLRLQTMRGAIGWSYELLQPEAQQFFRTVSVFSGGWTLALAAMLTDGASDALLDVTGTLVDNNLLVLDERGQAEPRYRMLDVIREFAAEQTIAHGEVEALALRHATLYADVAEAAERELGSEVQESEYRRLELEQDNMRAAIAWAIAHRDGRLAQRLGGALWLFWRRHGDYTEGRRSLDQALAVASSDDHPSSAANDREDAPGSDRAIRRKALWGDAWISYYQGDYPHVREMGAELLRLARGDDDRVGIRNGLTIEALVAMADERFEDAMGPLEASLEICRESCPPWLLATSLLVLGQAALHGTDLVRCRALLEEARSIYEQLGDRLFVARSSGYLGYAALLAGDRKTARTLFAESLSQFVQLGERFGIAEALQATATLAAAERRDERAAVLAGAAQRIWTSMSAQPLASDRPIASRYLDPARRRVGGPAWRSAQASGQELELPAVLRLAVGGVCHTRRGALQPSVQHRRDR
jgi:predicted ATPase/DNA-binding XRE family transcriptional regulator